MENKDVSQWVKDEKTLGKVNSLNLSFPNFKQGEQPFIFKIPLRVIDGKTQNVNILIWGLFSLGNIA